jgi:hypothetical protein
MSPSAATTTLGSTGGGVALGMVLDFPTTDLLGAVEQQVWG